MALSELNAPLSLGASFTMVNKQSVSEIVEEGRFECLRLLCESSGVCAPHSPHDAAPQEGFCGPVTVVNLPGLRVEMHYSIGRDDAVHVRLDMCCERERERGIDAAAVLRNLELGLMHPDHLNALMPAETFVRLSTSSLSRWSSPLEAGGAVHALHRADPTAALETLHVAKVGVEDRALCTLTLGSSGGAEGRRHGVVECHTLYRRGAARVRPRNEGEATRASRFDSLQGFFVWNEPTHERGGAAQVRAVMVARVPTEFVFRGIKGAVAADDIVTGGRSTAKRYQEQLGFLSAAMFTKRVVAAQPRAQGAETRAQCVQAG